MMVFGCPPWLAHNEIALADKVQQDELAFPPDRERTLDPFLKKSVATHVDKESQASDYFE
jgi:hypothetical protein